MADVLIIDDDIDCADALTDIVRAEGHDVRVGYNGAEGLSLAEQHLPDLAILDIEMPILDGPAMAYQMFVRDQGLERVPLILLSGAVGIKEVAAEVGTPYYLAKPYRYAPIVALIRRALAERIIPRPPTAAHGASPPP